MPDRIYSVSYGGRIYDVRAPENVNPERIYAAVRAQAGGGAQQQELGGFWSTLFEKAQTLGLADEAAAFASNPSDENRRALLAAGESKFRSVGFGEGENWAAFKQLLGGSLGGLLAPAVAGIGASFATSPVGGLAAFSSVSGTQYTTENLLRQAQEQERALREGRTPEETSAGKAIAAATGQTALDLLGGRFFGGIASKFPFMRPLLGEGGEAAAKEAGDVLADAAAKGTISFAGGVARGVGKGVAFEVPQEIAQSGLERWQAGLSLSSDEALSEYKQAAIGAAVLGGTFGSISGALESRGRPEEKRPVEAAAPPVSIEPEMDELVSKVITNPEDKAAFDALVTQYSTMYGVPEETAAKLALGALRPTPTPEAAPETAAPEVPEPTLRGQPAPSPEAAAPAPVIPPMETITPQAQVAEQLAAVVPPPVTPAAPVVEPAAPVAAAPTPVAEAAPVVETMEPNAIWASDEFDFPVTVLPEEPQIGEDGRAYQAVMYEGNRGVLPVDQLRPLEAAPEAPAVEEVAPEQEEAVPAEFLAAEDAFEEAAIAAPPAAPEPVAPEAVEEAPVPVTKVAPGVARGVKTVQRGTQGTQRGRPVEGAAQLTEGMRAQQDLTAELEAARDAREVSDAEVAEALDILRPPASEQELRALPPERRNQWLQAINAQRQVDEMQQRVGALPKEVLGRPNPERVDLEATLGKLQQNLDTIQRDIVGTARQRFEELRNSRKTRIQTLRKQLKSGELTPAQEREARIELRESRVSRAEEGIDGETTEVAAQAIEVAKKTKSIRSVIEFLAQQNTPLGEAARRLLPIVPNVRVTVAKPEVVRMMARNPGESLDNVPLVEGVYVPSRKTIFLRDDLLFDHVPLHEALHPIIDGHIQRGTPEGRELKDIYGMFEALASPEQRAAYGFKDAREFVAETWGNEKFRSLLRELTPVQEKAAKNLLQRVGDAIKRIFRKLLKSDKAAAPAIDYIERVMQLTEAAAAKPLEGEAISRAETPTEKINKGLFKAQMANRAAGFNEGLDEVTAGVKLEAKEKRKAAIEAMDSGVATPAFLAIQPTSWIRDAIVKKRPGLGSIIEEIDKLEQRMRGMRTSMERAMRRRVEEVEDFVNRHGQAELSAMMTIARVNRVDVTAYASRAEALKNDPVIKAEEARNNAKGVARRTKDINVAWDAWDALGKQKGGHETYKRMRQFYKDMYTALRTAQDEDIRNLGLDKDATDRLIRQARGDIDEDALVDEGPHKGIPESTFPAEYFPFRRFGEHVLIVQTGKRAERERYHFESARERNEFEAKRAKELGLQRGTDKYNETFKRLDGLENLRDDMSNESFLLGKLFAAIDDTKPTQEGTPEDTARFRRSLKDRVYQTYLMTLPERSLRKQFIHAELVTGQSADALRVFRVAAGQYAAQLPKVVYGNQIQTQIEAAYDTIKEGDPAERAKLTAMVDTIVSRTRDGIDPPERSMLEQRINEFTFLSLMTSVASAAVQPLTLPFQVMPRMVARYGPMQALKMVSSYTPLLSAVQTVREVDPATGQRSLVAPTIGNTAYVKNNPLRARLWKELDQKRDLFSQKQVDMLLRNRATPGTSASTPGQRALEGYEKLVTASGALFSSMDQITREISGMSFAELEYNKQRAAGKSHEAAIEAAAEAAVRNTNETIGNYTEVEKLDVFRGGPLRRMLGFLRTYSVQRTAYYFRMLNALTKGDPTQSRLQAFNELSMVLAFTSLGAGIGANFGYELICDIIDVVMAAMLSDEEKEEWRKRDPLGADSADYRFRFQWLPEQFGSDSMVTRIAQRGVLSELTGYDWTTRLSQSSLWLRDFQRGETLREDIFNFLATNLSPQVSQGANIIDGIDEFLNGNWSKGFTKIMPAAVRGMFTAERYASEGETTKSGLPVMGASEFSANELFGQVLGFTPNDLAREREMNRMTQAWKRKMKEERDDLFKEYRDLLDDPATTQEDIQMMVEKVMRYNAKVPLDSRGAPLTAYLIEPRDVMQSLRGRETREEKSYRGVQYAPGEFGLFFPYEKREPVGQ